MIPETEVLRRPQAGPRNTIPASAALQIQLSIFFRVDKLLASRIAPPILQIAAAPLKHFNMTGYSGTPLTQKLGIKPAMNVIVINEPANYRELLGRGADGLEFSDRIGTGSSFVHFFTARRSELKKKLRMLREKVADSGTVWVSWPKKSSGVATDVTEDVIRAVALSLGFVDVKVCAIDET